MLRGTVLAYGAAVGLMWSGLTLPVFAQGPSTASPATTAADADDANRQIRIEVIEKGTSSRSERKEAIQLLPSKELTPESQELVQSILDKLSLYRRLPVIQCESDPRVVQFFTEHPDVAVSIWRAMEISEFSMRQTGPFDYESDSGDGSLGTVQVLYRTPQEQLILCSGQFKSPALPKPIEARALMFMHADYGRDAQGKPVTTCRADVFVSFPSATVQSVARLIAPVSNRIADRNFEEVVTFIRMMHVAMTEQPVWVEQVAGRLEGVQADRPDKLVELTSKIYREQRLRQLPERVHATPEMPEDRRLPRTAQSVEPLPETPGPAPGVSGPLRSTSIMK